MYKISVILPVYNAEATIKNTLKSIEEQTIKELEIICVDDGSTDASADIIKKEQKEDGRIKYYFQENQGAGIARNKGIVMAHGEYIAFMDADDEYATNNALFDLYKTAKNKNAIVCGGSAVGNGISDDGIRRFTDSRWYDFKEYQFDYMFGRFIFNRDYIWNNKLIRFPELRVYEDPIFLFYALSETGKFYAVAEDVYKYNGEHQATTMNLCKTKDYLKGLIKELELTSKKGLSKLHYTVFERLEKDANYYAEKNLDSGDLELFKLLMDANQAVDLQMLYEIDKKKRKNYILPTLNTIWIMSNKYLKLRNSIAMKISRKLIGR